MARRTSSGSVLLRPADPFELIRWLARSQGDPRKAVAELVQNSLDAGARHIRVERRRERGRPALVLRDDGEGVIPEASREEALRYLATHVGHSRKLGLTPSQRAERVVAGQYGVGLLGFWAIGRHLELRTRVAGSPIFALELSEDQPRAEIVQLPLPLAGAPDTFTEVVVSELHAAASRALAGRRLADYLAAELRGQLLARAVTVTFHDGLTRGPSQRDFEVVPRRFTGERLALAEVFDVPGHLPLKLELYLMEGEEGPRIQVSCAGTRVADDLSDLDSLELRKAPWVGRSLGGLIEFPDFRIPPGTRRGVLPDAAAFAFAQALERLAPLVEAELGRLSAERRQGTEKDVLRELRKALRGLDRRLPNYDLPAVAGEDFAAAGPRGERGAPLGPGEAAGQERDPREAFDAAAPAEAETTEAEVTEAQLGLEVEALTEVRVTPDPIEVAPGKERRLTATPLDRQGQRVARGVALEWSVEGEELSLRPGGDRPALRAAPFARPGGTGRVRVTARRGEVAVEGAAAVRIVEPSDPEGARLGIPEPIFVHAPGVLWRSRLSGARWEINDAHEDYLALRADPKARLRYLLALLAKEIVQRSYAQPGSDALLDRMVEILAHAERNLRGL